jgi:hypothetical protein
MIDNIYKGNKWEFDNHLNLFIELEEVKAMWSSRRAALNSVECCSPQHHHDSS